MRTLRHLASWLLALFLAFIFLQATLHPLPDPPPGQVKFFDRPGENIVFTTMAMKTGLYWLEPAGRVMVGLAELVAAFLLLIPPLRRAGAALSALILLGAVTVHLLPGVLGREVPRSLSPSEQVTDGGALFALAVAMLTASILLYFVHPRSRQASQLY